MSNYLSIATVTATLQRILQQSIQGEVEGTSVTTSRPDSSGGLPETAVNVYLYHIKRNTALGNAETPIRQRKGIATKRNQIGIDLFYVITFYGDESELEAQRLMGVTLRTLEDNNILTPEIIRETISDPAYDFIADSDLANQLEMIRAEFLSISTDELSKIWSVFFQTPYALSVVYKVTVLLIEGEETAQMALPVRNRDFSILPLKLDLQPLIQQVTALESRYQPILRDTTIAIKGKRLGVQGTQVRVCNQLINPTWLRDTEIRFSLSALSDRVLRAGVQGIQVVVIGNSINGNSLPVESNVVPFVLRPTIIELSIQEIETFEDEPRSGRLRVRLDLPVSISQRVILMLNLYDEQKSLGYVFKANPREEDSHNVDFSFKKVEQGEYLVRVQVDGAESIIDYQNAAQNTSPRLIIP